MAGVNVTVHRQFGKNLSKIDGSLKGKIWHLVSKLSVDADAPGLDYKMPEGAGDRRIRTARVDLNYRAVMFESTVADITTVYLANVLPHDDAYTYAAKARLRVNPASGALEVRVQEASEVGIEGSAAIAATPPPTSTPSTKPVADDRPLLLPWSCDELVDLGIDADAAERAVAVRDEGELLLLAEGLPTWQGSVLLDLATGKPMDEVRREHDLQSIDPEVADTDEAIAEALRRPSSQLDFAVMTDDAALRRELEGDFAEWRLFLHPSQRSVAYRPSHKGSYRLTGGAGTGKTVVGIHRAVHLARRRPDARVLLCTFTTTLADQLRHDVRSLAEPDVAERVHVSTLDAEARRVVSRLTNDTPGVIGDLEDEGVWDDARDAAGVEPTLSGRFFKDEYEHVVLPAAVRTEDEYLKVARRGRGVRLSRNERRRVWEVVERYRSIMAANRRTTFQELTVRAAELLAEHPRAIAYDHVIVDEGQDLKPATWVLVRRLVAPGPDDIFICADAHQRLYGQRLVLSRYGIETRGRSRRLTLNYRMTAQILQTALGILRGQEVVDLEGDTDTTAGYRSVLNGAPPQLLAAGRPQEEADTVVGVISDWLKASTEGGRGAAPGEIGVLTRRRSDAEQLARRLRDAGLPARLVDQTTRTGEDPVHVMTMHRAKGQEFRRVVVAHVTDKRLPEPNALKAVPEEDRDDVRARERFLLYVACTRARDELVVTWNGTPSEFLAGVLSREA
jgi:superfamily I DNA/RNA helicase